MATSLTMPKLGMTMEAGTVHAWFKREGDPVIEGEPLLSVLTDKIDIEVDSPATGVLRKIFVHEGETVPVNTLIGIIADADADISSLLSEVTVAEKMHGVAVIGAASGPAERAAGGAASASGIGAAAQPTASAAALSTAKAIPAFAAGGPTRATPVARQLAREHGLDLAKVPGTGPRGRITRADVEEIVAQRAAAEVGARRVPFSGVRRLIADRMTASAFSAPHVTLTTEADVTELVKLRTTLNDADRARGGQGVSYTDLFIVIAARALQQHPHLNARLDGDEIVIEAAVHIGVAVALPAGLIVPVIHDVAELSVGAVARRRAAIVSAARQGTLTPDELAGGTFTISNLGAYDIDGFTPIINPPQAAILGMGRIVDKPAVYEGNICVRSMMTLSLSFDHRLVDGAPAAAFLQSIKRFAEQPPLLHL